jgi:hypothetical protein
MLASQMSTPHSGTRLLQWDPGPLSAGDKIADVAEGLTLGVRTDDHCGCAQAVAMGGDPPRMTPGWTRTGNVT